LTDASEAQRLKGVVKQLDRTIAYAVKMPLAFMRSRADVENFVVQMLGIRAIAFGIPFEKMGWKDWLAKRYPEIPEPDRDIEEATLRKYPHDDVARSKMFTEEMKAMVHELKQEMEGCRE